MKPARPSMFTTPQPRQDYAHTGHAALYRRGPCHLDVHDTTQCFLKAGTVVICLEGAIRITEAPWTVAEHMFQQRLTLREGEMHLLRASGWTTFATVNTAAKSADASTGQLAGQGGNRVARLAIQSTPDWSDRLSRWWARIVQRSIQ